MPMEALDSSSRFLESVPYAWVEKRTKKDATVRLKKESKLMSLPYKHLIVIELD